MVYGAIRLSITAHRIGLSKDYSVIQNLYLDGRCANTNKYFQIIGSIHDIESYFGIDNTAGSYVQIFFCHWGHKAIIFVWVSTNLTHIACFGNYELWEHNPIKTIAIAHGICDPHFGLSNIRNKIAYNGIYVFLYTLGFHSVFKHLYNFVITSELLGVISIGLALIHLIYLDSLFCSNFNKHNIWPLKFFCAYFDLGKQRVNLSELHQNSQAPASLMARQKILIGFLSIAWCAHLVHLAIPISRRLCCANALLGLAYNQEIHNTFSGNWVLYIGQGVKIQDKDNHIFRSTYGAGESSLTLVGGLKSNTISLYLTDIAHHHYAVGILFVLSTHLYDSLSAVYSLNLLLLHVNIRSILHLQLSLGCTPLAPITSVVGQQVYSLNSYVYLSYDYILTVALYVHHEYIASFFVMATLAHGGILLIREYTIISNSSRYASWYYCSTNSTGYLLVAQPRKCYTTYITITRITIFGSLSHLSWICLYLGFHTLGVYIHNDSIVAFQEQEKQILIEAVFGSICILNYFSDFVVSATMPLGPGDVLAHHAIALGLHVTILILFKGSLHGRGSKLMPDKINFLVTFACDGPIRGGTCDISAWDSNYLALFWMLNTGAWITFYFHWKHLTIIENTVFQFDESSTYLNGWFRDYLWFNSRPLMNGYNTFGANDLSILSWAFLATHLGWATGFMFLISWRGYWQELIDIILVMHLKTPILYNLWNGDIYTPVALSIVQARFVGLLHFSTGFIFTYAAFIIGATS